jgi:hypothetical protein
VTKHLYLQDCIATSFCNNYLIFLFKIPCFSANVVNDHWLCDCSSVSHYVNLSVHNMFRPIGTFVCGDIVDRHSYIISEPTTYTIIMLVKDTEIQR